MNSNLWWDKSWNPVTGCTPVSRECDNCWAARMARRLAGRCGYPATPHQFDVVEHWDRMEEPLSWRKPHRVFVVSMGDLFHADVLESAIYEVWRMMHAAYWHNYLVLTKRPDRMQDFVSRWVAEHGPAEVASNIHLLVTAGYQKTADERIPLLLQTHAAVRGVSIEPMLGPVDLWKPEYPAPDGGKQGAVTPWPGGLDWVILGCETGPGRRHAELGWMLDVAAQTLAAGVSLYVKQIEIDGKVSHDPGEWPVELRRREFPDEHNRAG